jgi:hypothetical protein
LCTPPVVLNEEKGSHHRVYLFHHTFSVCWTLSGFMLTLGGKPFLKVVRGHVSEKFRSGCRNFKTGFIPTTYLLLAKGWKSQTSSYSAPQSRAERAQRRQPAARDGCAPLIRCRTADANVIANVNASVNTNIDINANVNVVGVPHGKTS